MGLAQTRMLEMVKSELIMWVIMLGGSNSEKIAKKLLTEIHFISLQWPRKQFGSGGGGARRGGLETY